MNIAVFGSVPWDFLWQRPQHIASGLANKGHDILYFENPIYIDSPSIAFKRIGKISLTDIKKVQDHVWVASIYLPPFRGKFSSLKDKLLERYLRSTLKKLEFKPDVAMFYLLDFVPLVKPLKSMNVKIAFDFVDDMLSFPEFSFKKYEQMQFELIKASSCIFATSKLLCDKLDKHKADYVYLPNAMDFDHFKVASNSIIRLNELPNLKHPVIGFIGAFLEWVDDDLVCRLAEVHPEYSILLVGPVHASYAKLAKHKNIFMVGTKPYAVLPAYLSNMDVCLIPFKINNITLASNPIKMYEYLAAGKPVVSTALPEVVRNASEILYIGNSDDDFIRKVELAVAENEGKDSLKVQNRMDFAKNNSWASRVQVIDEQLREVVQSSKSKERLL